ncbi:LLM class flavin-dependent oxidoreductase [Actinoallomurus sp. CA-150999]|uniref:LLM class flavin-dependent oxidoreductase n=1 Tax=Actinoallomurus sp. CA-150999 TaxID=3239887 RepID=UPI003D91026D
MRRLWAGEPYGDEAGPIGPAPARPGGPQVLFGGFQPAALERVARWGDGFLAAAPPSRAGSLIDTVRRAWTDHGRDGSPRIVTQVNVALGPPSARPRRSRTPERPSAPTTRSPAAPNTWSTACSPPPTRSATRSPGSPTWARTRSCSTATAETPTRPTASPTSSADRYLSAAHPAGALNARLHARVGHRVVAFDRPK